MDTSAESAWSEELLNEVEGRARAVLAQTGFGEFADDLGSDAAWSAFNAGLTASSGPQSPGTRADRARKCLMLVDLVRSAIIEGEMDDAIRYVWALRILDGDVLRHVEESVVVAPRWRATGLTRARQRRRQIKDENRNEWAQEATRYRKTHPDAPETEVAAWVAERCDANSETVRKALGELRREARRSFPKNESSLGARSGSSQTT